ncbi:SCO-spondin-like isoform X3 [Mytilus edulis]|uniref:SCO-spondin-like isoform X3 n=1 Tax=Mytilus edulis TaxID=6550 RepID=UPI0039EFC848
MLFETIVVLTLSCLKEVFAVPCTEPSLSMCDCSGTVVNCANKNLAQIPRNIPTDTTRLALNQNKIQSIDATSLSGLTSLEMLFLEYNEISSIEDGAFSTLRSLVTLSIYDNKLTTIKTDTFKSLGSLRELLLESNEISSIEDGAFSTLSSLSLLNINDNKLTSIKPDTFKSLGSLRELNLKDNDLTTVSASVFADLTDIVYLYLRYNPLVCCKMTDLIDWWSNQTKLKVFEGDCTDFQTSTDLDEIDLSKCPVDGGWGSWSNPTCSVTCGNGIQSRNRSCDSPIPSADGKICNGSSVDTSDCSLRDCPVDGGWGSWSNPICSVTCGNGIQSRNRSCDSPVPSADGQTCNGSSVDTSDCSLRDCPVDGGWGSWSNPICSVTCGNGIQSRNRACDSPVPSADGKICNGSSVDTSDCSLRDCPVDGGWGSWSNPICSVTCGNGIQSRNRSCDSPVPSADGQTCNGSSVDTSDCSLRVCPVDGGWGSWSNPICSVTCGNGIQSRNRACDNPVPSVDGQTCNGSSVDTSDCSLNDCPVDGQWGSWSTGPCSVTCGNGIRYRKRSCDSPLASNNGQGCIGSFTVSVICTLELCSESRKMKAREWKRYQGRRLNSSRYQGRRLNSSRYHGRRLNSSRYQGRRLNSSRYHGRRLNSSRYHGRRLNSSRYQGRRLNSSRYHGRRLNSSRYHGRRLNSSRYQGRRLNSSRYHRRRLNIAVDITEED